MFEDETGSGDMICALDLKKFLEKTPHDIDLIVVAACTSERIGRIFQRCGVRHVVCVEQQRFVLDEAAIGFTQAFYKYLFKGERICDAFEQAVNGVELKCGEKEANLFMCLLAEEPEEQFFDAQWK